MVAPGSLAGAGFAPWFGLLGGMTAWFVHLCTTYVLVPFECDNVLLFHGLAAAFGAVAAAATWAAWLSFRRGGAGEEGAGASRRQGSVRFIGAAGLMLSGFFLVVILADWAPVLLQDPCLIPGPRIVLAHVGVLPELPVPGPAPAVIRLHEPGSFPVPGELWRHWSWKAWILIPLVGAGTIYARGVSRLWGRAGVGAGIRRHRAACYGAGLGALFVALVSPVDAWGAALFSAHMAQHLIIMVVAAPLLVLGRPVVAALWALPAGWSRRLALGWNASPAVRGAWGALAHPVSVWLLHVVAVWLWHVPVLYEAALHSELLHGLEHASFFLTALLFWHVLARARVHRWLGYGAGVLYVFAGAVQSGVLGALITFSPRPWYPSHVPGAEAWGLTALEDQQLAGLIMWVPPGVIYVAAALLLFLAWLAAAERRTAVAGTSRPSAAATRQAHAGGAPRPAPSIGGEAGRDPA